MKNIVLVGLTFMSLPAARVAEASKPCAVPDLKSAGGQTHIEVRLGATRTAAQGERPDDAPEQDLVRLRFERATEDGARGAHHSLVLEKAGQEVARAEAYDMISRPSASEPRWRNTAVVHLPEGVEAPFVVHAVDRAFGHRCSWTVDASGRIKRLPSSAVEPPAEPEVAQPEAAQPEEPEATQPEASESEAIVAGEV